MNVFLRYFLVLSLFLFSFSLSAQSIDENLKKAESYHNNYDFESAIKIYNSILENITDSLKKIDIIEKIVQCENGLNMLQYTTSPKVISTKTVSKNDFFLYYSHLKDKSWIKNPNSLVKEGGHYYYSSIFFPSDAEQVFFSAQDDSGSWNIYNTKLQGDSLWTVPQLINENLTSPEDDIFPILSQNGKELYFSSKGLFGMGGYDIFVSKWDDTINDWGIPENLGFPYSSPYDDLLFSNTPDNSFSVFASNRDCSRDSLKIYVLEFENLPMKKGIESIEKAREIAKLIPVSTSNSEEETSSEKKNNPSDSLFLKYTTLLSNLRGMQDSLVILQKEQKETRSLYNSTISESDLKLIEKKLLTGENKAIEIQSRIGEISVLIQELEMDFLMKGVIINLEDISDSKEKKEEIAPQYVFKKNQLGKLPDISVEVPVEKFDYSFKILDKAVFAVNNTLPDTLIYQIQLFVSSYKASIKQLHGLSPVFETHLSSGKYLYTVGLFYSYKKVLSHLNAVKKTGFPSSYIIAYNNGKSISVQKARSLENNAVSNKKFRITLEQFPDGIPSPVLTLVKEHSNKDIAKTIIDGNTIYIIAPFDNRKEAETLANILMGEGIEGINIEIIN